MIFFAAQWPDTLNTETECICSSISFLIFHFLFYTPKQQVFSQDLNLSFSLAFNVVCYPILWYSRSKFTAAMFLKWETLIHMIALNNITIVWLYLYFNL